MNVYVYILYKVYSNGVGVICDTFSSKKKATNQCEFIKKTAVEDRWDIEEHDDIYIWMNGHTFKGFKITPPSGRKESSESFFIIKSRLC